MKQIGFMTGCVVGTVLTGVVFVTGVGVGAMLVDWVKCHEPEHGPIHFVNNQESTV